MNVDTKTNKIGQNQDLNKYLGRNIRKRSKKNISKNSFVRQNLQKLITGTKTENKTQFQKDIDMRTPDIDTT